MIFVFEFRKINLKEKEDRESFLELMSLSLTERSEAWLIWKYMKNPLTVNEDPFLFCVVEKETKKVVGIRPFMMFKIRQGNRVLNAAQPCDTVVHPSYRGKGLFTKMTRYAIKQALNGDIDFFFNFPNSNSRPGYLKMGWKKVSPFNDSFLFEDFAEIVANYTEKSLFSVSSRLLSIFFNKANKFLKNAEGSLVKDKLQVKKEDAFTEEFESLWNKVEKTRFRSLKNKVFMNWRFIERPDKEYDIWVLRNEQELLAYLITTTSNRWGSLEGQIVDFQYFEVKYLLLLMKEAIKHLTLCKGVLFVSILCFTEKSLHSTLKNMGFYSRDSRLLKKVMPRSYMLLKKISENLSDDIYKVENWSLRLSDMDIY